MPVLVLAHADTNVRGDCRASAGYAAQPLRRRQGRRCVGSAESTQAGQRRASGSASELATPSHAIREWGHGRAGGRQRTASRGKRGRTRRPCPCWSGGRGASRSRCARSRGRRIGTCECLLFEQLTDSVRRRETPLVRVPGDLCAVLEPAARAGVEVGAAYASARGKPAAGARTQPRIAPSA